VAKTTLHTMLGTVVSVIIDTSVD